jgi:hypothetical protein
MAKGRYTRMQRNVKITFDHITAARLARAAERDDTQVDLMLEGWVKFNLDTIDPEGAADYVAPTEEGEQP